MSSGKLLSNTSGKELENTDHALSICLMYKLLSAEQQDKWSFEKRVGKGIGLPFFVIVGHQQRGRQKLQLRIFHGFCRALVTLSQCKNGNEVNPEAGIKLN